MKKNPRWCQCPRCGKPALKCHDGLTEYVRCAYHEIILMDGSAYPAAYSKQWYALHGVKCIDIDTHK